ncbi:MAG: sigma 54-interacting transcriptional regulator [Polyangia bacterium]
MVYRLRHAAAPASVIHESLAPLRSRLVEELARAAQTHRAVSVLSIHCAQGRTEGGRGGITRTLSRILRLIDTVAWDGRAGFWVLLPERDEAEAGEVAASILAALAAPASEARAGTATCPGDGIEVDALLSGAHAAMESAQPGQVRTAATAMTTVQVAGRSVLIADSQMLRLYALIDRLAHGDLPVLICGETGTGKELAAHALHERSRRASGRLVCLNCAALPETLAESELFGHERGAFSGAVASKIGLIEAAHGGTLFLDEVAELPLPVQAKLLRVLETKKLLRIGDIRERPVDVRIVAATHRDLAQEVARGRFREDLHFRLTGAVLTLPPLRERPRELPLLARRFLVDACERAGRPHLFIAPAALELLMRYRWPGNVRELRNAMEYAATVANDQVLEPENLPERLLARAAQGPLPSTISQPPAVAASEPSTPPPAARATVTPLQNIDSLRQAARSILRMNLANKLDATEEALVREALAFTAGNQAAAARLLGVHRKVIERRIDKFGASPQTSDAPATEE